MFDSENFRKSEIVLFLEGSVYGRGWGQASSQRKCSAAVAVMVLGVVVAMLLDGMVDEVVRQNGERCYWWSQG